MKNTRAWVPAAVVAVAVATILGGAPAHADAWSDQSLTAHNTARAKHGAGPLQWAAQLYPSTVQYANMCVFAHSNSGGQYGENLYATTNPNATAATAVDSWMAEAAQYDYDNPGFSAATGHFTQVVWKNTTQVAVAVADCPAGTIFPSTASKFIVARYTPPGNYQGQFPQNVGRPV
ncbi:CAP family protein [Nocardia alba]|uniref:Cysteine-rich secretory family protein n=1 Tax=Nocardia alba TaxID=225051 RepID=A0A4R1FB64_9NOCA|nr:CAP family protein [Nocardia alba]TCJ89949.1 cysteine-rich secretory family protein [Nocardia alba]